jgi:hypothetical protein
VIRALAAAVLLLALAACGTTLPGSAQGHRKAAPAGPPPPPMPDEPLVCPAEVRQCPDGSFVSRNPARDCEFDACPAGKP